MTGADRYGARACEDFEEDLVLYYYGEWQGAERDMVEKHLRSCPECEGFLRTLSKVLPLPDHLDEPPEAFWEQYSREMREKLAAVEEKKPWWESIVPRFRPWAYGAAATAFGIILSLLMAFGGGKWVRQFSSEERIPQEIQALPGDLEFFESLELMEVLDFLEAAETKSRGQKTA